jgi:transposase
MTQSTMIPDTTIGIDLGDKKSHICVLSADGEVQERAEVPTTMAALRRRFGQCEPLRIAIEAGGQSGWISELLKELGHDVIVANPRKLRMIYENDSKCDAVDAEQLARVARLDVKLLHPIQHRDRSARADLNKARSRDLLIATRTSMINHVRGVLKSFGARATNKAAPQFHTWIEDKIPSELDGALKPILDTLTTVNEQIKVLDKEIVRLTKEVYPEAQILQQVDRVGPHTSLRFILTIEDPSRIERSRDVGAYLGLVPKRKQSGKGDPEMRITKAGDNEVRRHLVQCAQQMLGPFGKDSDLRRWGLELAARGGKTTKKKAVIAVARKLAVVLHTLWRTSEVYEPLRNANRAAKTTAAAATAIATTTAVPA